MRSRLRIGDVLGLSLTGLRFHLGRTALTALGIAFGIAAIVAVLGISASGRAALLAQLDRLGTNLIRVTPSTGVFGNADGLPPESVSMLARVGPVERVTSTALLDVDVLANDLVSPLETGGLSVLAVPTNLPGALNTPLVAGRFLDDATATVPTTVLGRVAAERLGIDDVGRSRRVYIGEEWFEVIGILDEMTLHPDIERAALIGEPVARDLFTEDLKPTALYARVHPRHVDAVLEVIPATVNPENPDRVALVRPADALVARRQAEQALTTLLVSLGSVALLVGGVAIANVMVMSVLERRMEIGVRRALGATKGHVRPAVHGRGGAPGRHRRGARRGRGRHDHRRLRHKPGPDPVGAPVRPGGERPSRTCDRCPRRHLSGHPGCPDSPRRSRPLRLTSTAGCRPPTTAAILYNDPFQGV